MNTLGNQIRLPQERFKAGSLFFRGNCCQNQAFIAQVALFWIKREIIQKSTEFSMGLSGVFSIDLHPKKSGFFTFIFGVFKKRNPKKGLFEKKISYGKIIYTSCDINYYKKSESSETYAIKRKQQNNIYFQKYANISLEVYIIDLKKEG